MKKINTITKYEVEYGTSFKMNPEIIRIILQDSEQTECQTFGDADMEEPGLYEFSREGFKEATEWAALQDEEYFEMFRNMLYPSLGPYKPQVINMLNEVLSADSRCETVRIEIY